jgi:hypothetical protein
MKRAHLLLIACLLGPGQAMAEGQAGKSGAAGSEARKGYLLMNYPRLSARQRQKLLSLVPELTLGGTLENAGSASHPILCFAYESPAEAEARRKQLREVYGAADLAAAAKMASSCDDY